MWYQIQFDIWLSDILVAEEAEHGLYSKSQLRISWFLLKKMHYEVKLFLFHTFKFNLSIKIQNKFNLK